MMLLAVAATSCASGMVLTTPGEQRSGPQLTALLNTALKTPLELHRVTRAHQSRMEECFDAFSHWCDEHGLTLGQTAPPPDQLAHMLALYIQHCRDTHCRPWRGKYAVLGAQWRWRHVKGRIKRAWNAMAAWQMELPVGNRVPLPHIVLQFLFIKVVELALNQPRCRALLFSFACLLRLGHAALMRPGELASIRRCDVKLPRPGSSEPVVIAISRPKNRGHLGRVQFRLSYDQQLIAWLRWLLADIPSWSPVWWSSQSEFSKLLRWVLKRHDLQNAGITPASLRAGGATHMFACGVPVATLKFLGGWSNERTLSCYVQEAMAQLVWVDLGAAQAQIEATAASNLDVWARPPAVPWQALYARPVPSRRRRL